MVPRLYLNLFFMFIFSMIVESTWSVSEKTSMNEIRTRLQNIESGYDQEESVNLSGTSTLKDYLKIAALNNPGLRSAFYNWKSDFEQTGYVGALPDPNFMYGYFIEQVETRVGPQNQKFSIRQNIPWFGTLGAKKDIAFENSNISYKRFQAELLKVFYQVKAAYYDYYYLGKEIEITRENIELLTFWESVTRAKYKVALKQHPDVIKAQVELGKLEDQLLTLENKIRPTKVRLAATLNVSNQFDFPFPEKITIEETSLEEEKHLLKIMKNNPDLASVKHMIAKAEHAVRLATKSNLPNFTFGVDYIETGEALNPMIEGSGKDPLIASVGVNIPLWFGKNKSQKNEAKAKKKSAEYLYNDRKNQLRVITEEIIYFHNDALRKIRLYRDGLIPKAEQSLNAAYTSYQAGKAEFLTVLDAQRQLLRFLLELEMSKTKLAKRKAELDMLTGIELKTQEESRR